VVRVLGENCTLANAGTPTAVAQYVAQRRDEGASDNTISKELLALEAILQIALREGAWSGDVTALRPMGFSSGYEPRRRALTRTEYEKLWMGLPPARRLHLDVAVVTGARRSELPNVRIVAGVVSIAGTKTRGAARTFALVAPWQSKILATTATVDGLAPWGGMNSDLVRAAKKAGIDPVTPNDLRRTFASWLIEAGVTREEVAAMLGHRGVSMVYRVYGRADAAKEGEAIRRRIGNEIGNGAAPGMHRTDPSQLPACDPNPAAQVSVFFG
jgi:integrase